MPADSEKIENLLTRNVEEVIEKDHLEASLRGGKKLRVKLGIDPTSPDLHLGHAVVLRKLKEFQDLGHRIVLIIGDFTGQIGDPSARTDARKPLTPQEVKKNWEGYQAQAGKVIDVKSAEIFYNSEWFKKEGAEKIVELASVASIQQALKRADFKKRIETGRDVSLLEVLYPVFQGYDSVKVKADVELGGTDQTLNILMGRQVQRHFGMAEQDILTVPLLEGTDGIKKMSKSVGNYIGLTESADEMFGKVMSLPDKLMHKYFLLCTELGEADIKKFEKELGPRDLKARLGFEIAKLYHGGKEAERARKNFEKLFSRKEIPEDAPVRKVARGTTASLLIFQLGVVTSRSKARALVEQGALEIDGGVIKNPNWTLELHDGQIVSVKIGKRHFFKVKI